MSSKTGHIYKLCCTDPNVKEVYIGSTSNPRVRKCTHKNACNSPSSHNYNYNVYQYIRAHGGWDNWQMVILEANIRYDEKFELRARERHWLEILSASLNSNTPNRTMSEWHQDNREPLAIYKKQYRQDNIEAVKSRQKEKIECDCGITYNRSGKSQHNKRKKHKQYQELYDYITS